MTDKPTVTVKHHTYQPTRAKLRKPIHIPTTPEKLGRMLTRQLNVKEQKPK